MPKKIRQLMKSLIKEGFINRGGKGSHRNYKHPKGVEFTLSGNEGNDARRYQEKGVEQAIIKVKE